MRQKVEISVTEVNRSSSEGRSHRRIVPDILKRATVVEVKWVACLIQDSVNCKGFVSVNFL
jgi:hypothetical protein